MKTTCLIVEDEPKAAALLSSYIEKVSFLKLESICYNSTEALAHLKSSSPDIIFMDIEIPGFKGIELARVVGPGSKIIFTTAYSEYAAESYSLNATDYLVKPIVFERFLQAVMKASKQKLAPSNELEASEHDFIFLKTGKKLQKVDFGSIIFFEGQKEYVRVKTKDDEFLIYKRMKELAEQLPANFLRIHQSYIINLSHIDRIEDNHVFMDGQRISITEKFRSEFNAKVRMKLI